MNHNTTEFEIYKTIPASFALTEKTQLDCNLLVQLTLYEQYFHIKYKNDDTNAYRNSNLKALFTVIEETIELAKTSVYPKDNLVSKNSNLYTLTKTNTKNNQYKIDNISLFFLFEQNCNNEIAIKITDYNPTI